MTQKTANAVGVVAMIQMKSARAATVGFVASTNGANAVLFFEQFCVGARRKTKLLFQLVIGHLLLVFGLPKVADLPDFLRIFSSPLLALSVVFIGVFGSLRSLAFVAARLAIWVETIGSAGIAMVLAGVFGLTAVTACSHKNIIARS